MSTQITTSFVQQYRSGVELLVQQKGSRLRDAVWVETGVHAKNAYFDQIGITAAVPRLVRHADTPQIDTPHARRRVTLVDYEWADLVDDQDKVRSLNEFTSPYQEGAASAMGRAIDDVLIGAAFATAYTGETGATATPFDSGMQIGAAASGMTLAKLLSAKELLDAEENDPDEPRYVACSAKQVTNLLNTTEVKSADYNTVKALARGEIDTFLGFKFVRTQRLGTSSGSRRCIAWRKSGLLLAVGKDVKANISERPDKSYAMQVYFSMSIGAVRMQEKSVVEILCTEA